MFGNFCSVIGLWSGVVLWLVLVALNALSSIAYVVWRLDQRFRFLERFKNHAQHVLRLVRRPCVVTMCGLGATVSALPALAG